MYIFSLLEDYLLSYRNDRIKQLPSQTQERKPENFSFFSEDGGMQIQGIAGIADALFSESSPVIYERGASLREDNAI